MKLLFVCVAVCLLIAVSSKSHSKSHSKSQESTEPVYIPFTNEELEAFRTDKTNDLNPSNKHNLNTQDQQEEQRLIEQASRNDIQVDYKELSEEEQEDKQQMRKEQYRKFNKLLKYGLYASFIFLAIFMVKCCVAKRRMACRMRLMQPPQQFIGYPYYGLPINYPQLPVHQNMMNPHYQHAQQVTQQVPQQVWPQNPQQARPAIPKPNPSAYIVRGRPHDSIVQASPVGKGIEDYISYHQKQLQRLNNMLQQQKRRDYMPIPSNQTPVPAKVNDNTCEPIYYKNNIPISTPVCQQDNNSSFASDYPQI